MKQHPFTADELVMLAPLARQYEELSRDLGRPIGSINRKVMELQSPSQRPNALSAHVRDWLPRQSSDTLRVLASECRRLRATGRAAAISYARQALGLPNKSSP